MKIYTFDEAFQACGSEIKHLLMGNGFSQSCFSDIFSYSSLFDASDFTSVSPTVRRAFDLLKTRDFESVIRVLQDASTIIAEYSSALRVDTGALAKTMSSDAEGLKNILTKTLSDKHPDFPNKISDSQYSCARKFLELFKNKYTLNYDLLLYWALMHKPPVTASVVGLETAFDDGFRDPDSGTEHAGTAEYVSWEITNSDSQNVYFLHGALHLFTSKTELKKYTWSRTGVSLLNQIRESLDAGLYPLVVTEGTAEQKMEKIMRSAYLQRGLKSISKITGNLFVFGWAASENDHHVLHSLEKNKSLKRIWVSVYGDPNSDGNKQLMTNVKSRLELSRARRIVREVFFYQAESTKIWK